MKYKIIAVLVVCIAFMASTIMHRKPDIETIEVEGSIPYKSKIDLIQDADIIISGTVKELLPSKWSDPNFEKRNNIPNIIQTNIAISVSEIFKGIPYNNSTIQVKIDKGQIGNTVVISNGYPDFKNGEEVILFLSEDNGDLSNPNENYYVLTGMNQGKFDYKLGDKEDRIYKNINDRDTIIYKYFKNEIEKAMNELDQKPKPVITDEERKKNNEKLFGK